MQRCCGNKSDAPKVHRQEGGQESSEHGQSEHFGRQVETDSLRAIWKITGVDYSDVR
jgi:hypothetical protein